MLLLLSFSKPVIIANLAAWPIAYLAMSGYLSMFASSAGLTAIPFVASLIITLLIAWLAVGVQALRAARMKQAGLLRYE
jgi:putative ABC transport system permease protein